MTSIKSPRQRASLDLGDMGDFKKPGKQKPIDKKTVLKISEEQGFTSRQSDPKSNLEPDHPANKPTAKIDGRTLRATGRSVQLNIAVKPQTKDQFWLLAQKNGFTKGEEFLLALMNHYS